MLARLALGLLVLACSLICSYGTYAVQQPDFPDSPLGRSASRFIQTINGAEPDVDDFIQNSLSDAALQESKAAARRTWLRQIQSQSGGVEVAEVREISQDLLEIYVRTRHGNRWVRFYAFADRDAPDRIREYGAVPIRDPQLDTTEAWPEARVDPSTFAQEIDWRASNAAKRDEFSGVILVAKDKEILYQKAFGLADKNWEMPNQLETKFNLASANKMFTAVAIGQLLEAGKLKLTTTVGELLPDYPNPTARQQITIDHLLRHRAGLGMLWERTGFSRRERYPDHASFLPLFAGEPLYFAPDSGSAYSNEGFLILGAVIEKISGQSYEEYVAEHIFAKAGMVDSGFPAIDDVATNLAVGYGRFENDPLGIGPRRPNWIFLGWRGNACGGGYSSAPDLHRFFLALRQGSLLRDDTLRLLTEPDEAKAWYARGFQCRTVNGHRWRGHGGGGPNSGIEADAVWDCDTGHIVIVLGNYDPPNVSSISEGITKMLSQ